MLNLSKDTSCMIKGLAVSLIVLSHIFSDNTFLSSMGLANVVLLFILSGYGLTKRYHLYSEEAFFKQRLLKLYVPYFIVALIDILILVKLPLKIKILTLFCLDWKFSTDVSMWYIAALFIWYLLFGIVLKVKINKKIKLFILLMFGLALRFQKIGGEYSALFSHMRASALAFPIGVFLAEFEEKFKRIIINIETDKVVCSVLAVLYLYFLYRKNHTFPYIYAGFIIVLFVIIQKYNIKNAILLFLGTISYEIYLWELKLIYFFILRKYGYIGYFMILLGISAVTYYGYKFIREKVSSLFYIK